MTLPIYLSDDQISERLRTLGTSAYDVGLTREDQDREWLEQLGQVTIAPAWLFSPGALTGPSGASYQGLLNVALKYCAYALLVRRHEGVPMLDGVREAYESLHPWLIEERPADQWPGTPIVDSGQLLIYRYTADWVRAALNLTNRLFQWVEWLSPSRPEDLCLFRPTGEPWLVTVAHERVGWLYLTDDEVGTVQAVIDPYSLKRRP